MFKKRYVLVGESINDWIEAYEITGGLKSTAPHAPEDVYKAELLRIRKGHALHLIL